MQPGLTAVNLHSQRNGMQRHVSTLNVAYVPHDRQVEEAVKAAIAPINEIVVANYA